MKEKLKNNIIIWRFATVLSKIFGFKKSINGNHNIISTSTSIFNRNKIRISGTNNNIKYGNRSYLIKCNVNINGNNNKVIIGDSGHFTGLDIRVSGNNNTVKINNKTTMFPTLLSCMEGSKIIIGEDCMFSSKVNISTGDSHSVIDKEGRRLNISKDVNIGDHIWIGHDTIITKGVFLKRNTIVGTGSVVTKSFMEEGIVIAGNPAVKVKKNINWIREII